MKIIDHLVKSVRSAAIYNREVQVEPCCILWPDKERQWEGATPELRAALPELWVLGEYEPERRVGPAIWLRCVLAGQSGDFNPPEGRPPILYLPGVSRQDLRAVESCPEALKPLAELQFRGAFWSQQNTKDWTILAFLKSNQGGLGLDVLQDAAAKTAMQRALPRLLEEDEEPLRGKRLDKNYFNTLLTGDDPIRELLRWLDLGEEFQKALTAEEWMAFIEICRSKFEFNPEKEGALTACMKLVQHEGPWLPVWKRFCEAPNLYPNIPSQIRKCTPPRDMLFWDSDTYNYGGWPQWNDDREEELAKELLSLGEAPAHKARKRILQLEEEHSRRRSLVWAVLGEAPLASALEHLAVMAKLAENKLEAGAIQDLERLYSDFGWRVDNAAFRALTDIKTPSDFEAVKTAIRSVYLPWAEDSALYLQKLAHESGYPGGNSLTQKSAEYAPGDCVMFVDGLRYDAAKTLAASLKGSGLEVSEEVAWAALPSITETGKPAVSPVSDKISGKDVSPDFEPVTAETEQSLRSGYHLKKLIVNAGWTILDNSFQGDGNGKAWCETGEIDSEGHNQGWRLARRIDAILSEVGDRVRALLKAGWKRVHIVTDHGWILLPGGLPKANLHVTLAESKWGRHAALKQNAATDLRLYPWHWNPNQFFAQAEGISCFRAGMEYAHGGVSLQECMTLKLTVTGEDFTKKSAVEFSELTWKGLRCFVSVDGKFSGLFLDVRIRAGDPSSSAVLAVRPLKDNGTASVVVEDEGLEGNKAFAVLVDGESLVIAQIETVIGGCGE